MQRKNLINLLNQKSISRRILRVFEKVPRENFVPEELKELSYENTALSIGEGQTISQPYTIAIMIEMLDSKKGEKILEIGSGCGYVLALLSELVGRSGKIFGIEIIKKLVDKSRENLKDYKNIEIFNKDGAQGLKERALFDKILISAAIEKIPEKIIGQLKEKGILVAPVGKFGVEQSLIKFQKVNNKLKIVEAIPGFVFVPFVKGN
jgi:protein-L-isoaspartate(D-aspartate) O-methyltransferase